jgi:hypothetical protein
MAPVREGRRPFCHREERGDAAISIGEVWIQEIAASLRFSQ